MRQPGRCVSAPGATPEHDRFVPDQRHAVNTILTFFLRKTRHGRAVTQRAAHRRVSSETGSARPRWLADLRTRRRQWVWDVARCFGCWESRCRSSSCSRCSGIRREPGLPLCVKAAHRQSNRICWALGPLVCSAQPRKARLPMRRPGFLLLHGKHNSGACGLYTGPASRCQDRPGIFS